MMKSVFVGLFLLAVAITTTAAANLDSRLLSQGSDVLPVLSNTVDAVGGLVGCIGGVVEGLLSLSLEELLSIIGPVRNLLVSLIRVVRAVLSRAGKVVYGLVGGVLQLTVDIVSQLANTIIGSLLDALNSVFAGAVALLYQLLESINLLISSSVNESPVDLPQIEDTLYGEGDLAFAVGGAVSGLTGCLTDLISGLLSVTTETVIGLLSSVKNLIRNVVGAIKALLNRAAENALGLLGVVLGVQGISEAEVAILASNGAALQSATLVNVVLGGALETFALSSESGCGCS